MAVDELKINVTDEDIKKIVTQHYSPNIENISEIKGGYFNRVFIVQIKGEERDIIVRVGNVAGKFDIFLKEQWCCQMAREKGIPAPEPIAVGNTLIPHPYAILRKERGTNAQELGKDLERIWVQMGVYTAIINSIETKGYGNIFDWADTSIPRNKTWQEFWKKEARVEEAFKVYEKHEVLTKKNLQKLKRLYKEFSTQELKPNLNHGDMKLRNILVDAKGNITSILDWELASSQPAPYTDVIGAIVKLEDSEASALKLETKTEKEEYLALKRRAFLKGYGLEPNYIDEHISQLKLIGFLNWWWAGQIVHLVRENLTEELEEKRVEYNEYIDSL